MRAIKRIAIVAGEESGDILGAGLIAALKKLHPNCQFEGIGGSRMQAEGFVTHFPLERLAVMGLVEPLKRLPELLNIRGTLLRMYCQNPPDIFIGIDSPDFNLALEEKLRNQGIKTVHYVSPSVWAWRQKRVFRIARGVDLMLTLFPFEADFYKEHQVPVVCVGHPLADNIPVEDTKESARAGLGLAAGKKYLAILPGSRQSEVEKLIVSFLAAARLLKESHPELEFLIPAANSARKQQIEPHLQNYTDLKVHLSLENSHQVMAAADAVLISSGTTTLEALLLKRPMVIAYRVAWLSYKILKRLVKSKYIGLPNLLAKKLLVPELIQDAAEPAAIADAVEPYIYDNDTLNTIQGEYVRIHRSLKLDASKTAAEAIQSMWEENKS